MGLWTAFISNFKLDSNGLSGPIPSELGVLTAMVSAFYLNDNSLCGDIPQRPLGIMVFLKFNIVKNIFVLISQSLSSFLSRQRPFSFIAVN